MYQPHRYRATIVNAYQTTLSVYLVLIGLATVVTTTALFASFRYYRQRTAMTYIFHQQGAALQIYDTSDSRPVILLQPSRR